MTATVQDKSPHVVRDGIPDPDEFFLQVPLYRSFDLRHLDADNPEVDGILRVEFFDGSLKTLCLDCGEESIFRTDRIQSGELHGPYRRPQGVTLTDGKTTKFRSDLSDVLETGINGRRYALSNHFFYVELYCTRNHTHRICFCFSVYGGQLTKIGQYPSISDLSTNQMKGYRQILGPEKAAEYMRAVNLFSHDIGIGSFVYLRRIFESFIDEAHRIAEKDETWKDEDFAKERMDEKILSLHSYLPDILVENRAVYGILSKGIHELSEEECLKHFNAVRASIDLAIEERILELVRETKRKTIREEVGRIKGELEHE